MKSREEMIAFCRESLGLPDSIPIDLLPLEVRGSDRAFFRIQWTANHSAILVRYDPKREENTYFAAIAVFLREKDIPAPRLIRHAPAACLIIMEDLGDIHLWSLRNSPWQNRLPIYRKTLAIAHRLHSLPERDFPSGRVKLMEGFGSALYRWERDYFKQNFVRNFCGIKLDPLFERELESELFALGERLSGSKQCLVHRDLQSQNVMLRDEEPFLIDFQGMRLGSPFYDLGSLLCDPYVDFDDREREELLSFYYQLLRGFDQDGFRMYFWEASAQRLMQALGAYGFLGITKGLTDFLGHIPGALRNLHRAASHSASLPRLRDLSVACQKVMDRQRSSSTREK